MRIKNIFVGYSLMQPRYINSISMLVVLLILLTSSITSSAEENILSFYEKAVKRIDSPPDESQLSVICRKKIDDLYVTFVGTETDKVLLAAITQKKLKKPNKEILLKVHYAKSADPRQPVIFLPTREYVMDWSYIYDRNGDGKIDYLVFNVGTFPIKKKDFPSDYPKRNQNMDLKEFEVLIHSVGLIFTHHADDNYDGKIDAAVLEACDPERDWAEGWMAVRSTKYDGVLDEGWFFKEDINVKEKDAERVGNGFKTRRMLEMDPVFGPAELDKMNSMMKMINEAAEKCNLTSNSFYRP